MFSGITLPFSPGDLVSSGNEILGLVGSFVLLGMAFAFTPAIIGIIRHAFYVREATSRVGNPESRKHFQKSLWNRHEVKQSIRMQYKGEWK